MKERLSYLFSRYLHNAATDIEFEEFLGYVKDAKTDLTLRELIRDVYNNTRDEDASLASYIDENGNLVLNTPGAEVQNSGDGAKPARRGKRSIVAVLLLVAVLTGGSMWRMAQSRQNTSTVRGVKEGNLPALAHSFTKKFTEHSEYKFMVLPDSTQVWLNVNSSFEYPDHFDGKSREVYLSGEAFFDVKHMEDFPFIIHTGKITTTVLGTAFNIKAYPYQHSVLVSVSRGKVRVSKDDHVVAVLIRGQQAKVSNIDSLVKEKEVEMGELAFWQQGYLTYDDETIGEIVQDLSHVYNVPISIANPALEQMKITTSFKRDIGIDPALKLICHLIDGRIMNVKGQYIIQSM